MCLGIPGRIIERSPGGAEVARVDVDGVIREINLALLEDDPPQPGDWILIHLGFALEKMTEADAHDLIATIAELSAPEPIAELEAPEPVAGGARS